MPDQPFLVGTGDRGMPDFTCKMSYAHMPLISGFDTWCTVVFVLERVRSTPIYLSRDPSVRSNQRTANTREKPARLSALTQRGSRVRSFRSDTRRAGPPYGSSSAPRKLEVRGTVSAQLWSPGLFRQRAALALPGPS